MPIYDYRCTACRTMDERMRQITERDEPAACPNCGSRMERQLTSPLFRFKGVVTKGGGPDKFTADMLGIPLHDLPDGLKTK